MPEQRNIKTGEELFNTILQYCAALITTQPFMASNIVILNAVIEKLMEYEERKSLKAFETYFRKVIRGKIEETEIKNGKMTEFGNKIIKDNSTIITYSYSGSVASILLDAKKSGKNISVILSEGRPMLEGKRLAQSLSKNSIPVKLIIDAALPQYVKYGGIVLLGADWIAENYFINKIGTTAIVQNALNIGVPVYVTATIDKILSEKYRLMIEDSHSPAEIMDEEIEGIQVENPYFEEISSQFVEFFVTDNGLIKSEDIKNIADKSQINSYLSSTLFNANREI